MPLEEALDSYIIDVLASAPDEMLYFGEPTAELPVIVADAPARESAGPRSAWPGGFVAAAGITVLTARLSGATPLPRPLR